MTLRLSPQVDEWIDRHRDVRFRFEGREYHGFVGDTVSSALWANGVRVLGRSFKYHRPRGIYSLADLDVNAIVETASETNIRADITSLREGMDLRAVNTRGGVLGDRLAILDRFGKFTPVGFYYKAFHTPRRLFPFYERRIREIAGLGTVNTSKKTAPTPKDYAHTDVLVVGAGPAGMAAALAAADRGVHVTLVERSPHVGGTLCYERAGELPLAAAQEWRCRVGSHPRIELRTSTVVAGHYADRWLALVGEQRLTKARASAVVVASGGYPQPAVFRNNDLPGVMLASAAQRLIYHYAVRPCTQAVVLTANADGYGAALDLEAGGVAVVAIVDLRLDGDSSLAAELCRDRGIPIRLGEGIYEAVPARGKRGVRAVRLCSVSPNESARRLTKDIACDGVALSVGWAPADELLRMVKTRMDYCEALHQFVPTECPLGVYAAGRVNGLYGGVDSVVDDGRQAGETAARFACGAEMASARQVARTGPARSLADPFLPHPRGKEFVDFDEDLQLKDFANSFQEGFDNIELLKRYSTFGMGPSQGKHSNLNALRLLCQARGESLVGKSLTTARPFTASVSLAHLAGRIFTPLRRTALHARHEALGARFMYVGNWLRPEYYETAGLSRAASIAAEATTVREKVGLIDLGTLGKIEINGPNAVAFIERIYTGRFAKLKVGDSRYGAACDESGVLVDDSVVARLGEERFYVSATSSGAEAIYREFQRLVIEWGLNVTLNNATNHYAALNIAGPLARRVLRDVTDIELDAERFPYLAVREGEVAGVPARVLRVGFVGELSYEIHVPAGGMLAVWDALIEKGRQAGIRAFGVEAQRLLRLEKGHIIVGHDTDGLTNPFEAEVGWAVKMDKPFFVGQRSLAILQQKPRLRTLVGFVLSTDHRGPIPQECHLVIDGEEIIGRVTSVSHSPTLGHVIGLAYVPPTSSTPGTEFFIRVDGCLVSAHVVELPFYDPKGERQQVDP